jgi:hypothetical protein
MRTTLEEEAKIMSLLSDGIARTEAEITEGLGRDFRQPVSISLLERMEAAGKIELSIEGRSTYLVRRKESSDEQLHAMTNLQLRCRADRLLRKVYDLPQAPRDKALRKIRRTIAGKLAKARLPLDRRSQCH